MPHSKKLHSLNRERNQIPVWSQPMLITKFIDLIKSESSLRESWPHMFYLPLSQSVCRAQWVSDFANSHGSKPLLPPCPSPAARVTKPMSIDSPFDHVLPNVVLMQTWTLILFCAPSVLAKQQSCPELNVWELRREPESMLDARARGLEAEDLVFPLLMLNNVSVKRHHPIEMMLKAH